MGLKTPLHDTHVALGAKMVPFGDWDMPLHYGSQIEEHHAVRRAAGMFDVSHMQVVDLGGDGARGLLRRLLANDVAKLRTAGKALYACMLNERGGVIDDLIVYYLAENRFRMVVNAATASKDIAWIRRQAAGFPVEVRPRDDLAMIAVQGPRARELAIPLLPQALQEPAAALKPFSAAWEGDWMVARTGYTGEDGVEIMLPAADAPGLWQALAGAGVQPCGLGARDTLRLEAGMNLYGSDMDEETSPLEAGLGWTLAWEPAERAFIGREAIEGQRTDPGLARFVGLVLLGRGVLRNHQRLFDGDREIGEITSGGFSPTMQRAIALARVNGDIGDTVEVDVRGRRLPARIVRPPFVRNGQVRVEV
jgi:aminomethyltransferase